MTTSTKVALLLLFLVKQIAAAPPCGAAGESARSCGGPNNPKNCCPGLVCNANGFCDSSSPTPPPTAPPPSPTSSSCPDFFSVDCISWSEGGGSCQALHAIVRLRDDAGQPVNGVDVQVNPNIPISGIGSGNSRTTTPSLSTNYQGEVLQQCLSDPTPFSGTTAAFCWQQTVVGEDYTIDVIDITWPDCPTAQWAQSSLDSSTYTFTGTACS